MLNREPTANISDLDAPHGTYVYVHSNLAMSIPWITAQSTHCEVRLTRNMSRTTGRRVFGH